LFDTKREEHQTKHQTKRQTKRQTKHLLRTRGRFFNRFQVQNL
jgi:hypothetical protein